MVKTVKKSRTKKTDIKENAIQPKAVEQKPRPLFEIIADGVSCFDETKNSVPMEFILPTQDEQAEQKPYVGDIGNQIYTISDDPEKDGYEIKLNGWPYHAHPKHTPEVWAELQSMIAAEKVTIAQKPVVKPTPQEIRAALIQTAQVELGKSDITLLRCVENKIDIPSTWIAYREKLRDIISGKSDVLPDKPAYP